MERLPTLRQLQHFVALAEHLHFGKAANAVHVTQSTLSASLKELEDALGAPLVDRTKRSVALTPLGRDMSVRARDLLAQAEELAQAARAAREPLSGPLRLGVIPTIGPFLLPRALPGLRRRFPKLQLYLVEDLTERLVASLKDGQVDAALIALPYAAPGLDAAELFDDPFLIAAPKDHALLKRDRIAAGDLDAETLLLLRDGHCLRDHALSACGLGGPRHAAAFEATSLMTLMHMVDAGLGVTLIPRLAADNGLLKGLKVGVRALDEDAPARTVALVWRKGSLRRTEFERLAAELKAQAE